MLFDKEKQYIIQFSEVNGGSLRGWLWIVSPLPISNNFDKLSSPLLLSPPYLRTIWCITSTSPISLEVT